jgi:arylsulfatase A-like enzyme
VAEVPLNNSVDGRSLQKLLSGGTLPDLPLLFEIRWKRRMVGQALIEGPWKLIAIHQNYEGLKDTVQLYNLEQDPLEKQDLAALEPEQLGRMQQALQRMVASFSPGADPLNVRSEMNEEQLKALGYME